MKNLTERFEKLNLTLVINEELLTARAFKTISKARFPKNEFHYRFRNLQNMQEFLTKFIQRREDIENDKKERKEKISQARENIQHPYKLGQIIYDSWGWEQTNIDFYQVVEVGAKSIKIQRISQSYAKEQHSGNSSMSAYVVPNANDFIGDPILKKIVVSFWNNQPNFYIKSNHGSFSAYVDNERGVYSSWYA